MKNKDDQNLNRRQFIVLTTVAALGKGFDVVQTASGSVTKDERIIDAGPAVAYSVDGIYNAFRHQGFFVIRHGSKLFALSSICTHKHCKISSMRDRSFSCPCHGSEFDSNGKVTQGPATRDLPLLSCVTDARGHLLVKVAAT